MRFFQRKIQDFNYGSPDRQTFGKILKNKLALIAFIFLALEVITAIAGYLITADPTPMANRQLLEISARKPGFSVLVYKIPREEPVKQRGLLYRMLFGQRSSYNMIPINSYVYENGVLTIREYTGEENVKGNEQTFKLEPQLVEKRIERKRFLLGTDQFGRDLLSRLIIGARVSLAVGLISVVISLVIGLAMGMLGGYFRGKTDAFIVWLINVVWSVPTLLLVIAITFALGKGFWQIFIAVGLTMWIDVARVTRGQVISVREKEYVEAAKALGFSDFRIIFRHIFPNIAGPVIVISAANFASAILIEAGLSFLGIGVQPPMPSWGSMIRENYAYLLLDASHLAVLPGLAIMLTVLSFMIIGNALRDILDVRTEEKNAP